MYYYLKGILAAKSPAHAVVDAGGIGFYVRIPLSTFSALPAEGQSVTLLTHFLVREDAQQLFGFMCEEERDLFRLLISVSGIGPKVAMTAMSGIEPGQLQRAIVDGNLVVLTGIPGIGKKTAERLVVELREKLVIQSRSGTAGAPGSASRGGGLVEDSVQALIALGYKKQNARAAIDRVLQEEGEGKLSIEDMIRGSLKYIS